MRVAQKKKTFARTVHQSLTSNPKTLSQRKKTDNNRREPQRLKSAEPEGVALARPPENIFVKDILEIVGGSTPHEKGAISDVLLRRDQAAQKALEGITGGGMGVRWGAIYKRSVKIAAASKTGVYSLILVTLG